jgi:hypothetical protein
MKHIQNNQKSNQENPYEPLDLNNNNIFKCFINEISKLQNCKFYDKN